MKYCTKCLAPDTRPDINFENGVCAACIAYEKQNHTDWDREGTIEQCNQIDSLGYLLSQYLKYPKFGHASATEMTSRWIRSGMKTREEMIPLLKKYDKILDQGVVDKFC